jgi:site-specific DNA-cytosine methylase
LEQIGYQAAWGIFSASEVGAPHQRKRVFILAYDQRQRVEEFGWQIAVEPQQHSFGDDGGDRCGKLADGSNEGLQRRERIRQTRAQGLSCGHATECSCQAWPSRPGELVNAEHDGHAAPEVAGGNPESANARRAQEPKVNGESARGCYSVWPSRPGQPQHGWEPPRVIVADSKRTTSTKKASEWKESIVQDGADLRDEHSTSRADVAHPQRSGGEEPDGQVESALGGGPSRNTDWLDDAELFTTCDNRTDELRLLGNGVVPATAERAFRVLIQQLDTPPQTH